MNKPLLTLTKIILSVPIGYGLALPFLSGSDRGSNTDSDRAGGILAEIQHFGAAGATLAIVGFLLLVFFYARDLKRSLALVSPGARKAAPSSVWLMFLLPYNFIEDFFIVANVARSLQAEAQSNAALARFRSFGLTSGIGWCAAQIVSLLPTLTGSIAGLVALVFWAWHWTFVKRANRVLESSRETGRKS